VTGGEHVPLSGSDAARLADLLHRIDARNALDERKLAEGKAAVKPLKLCEWNKDDGVK
jgi:hypothetical protein